MSEALHKARIIYNIRKLEFNEKQAKRKSTVRLIISILMGIIVFYMLFTLFNSEVPQGNREVIYLLVGNVTGAFFGTLINYYFGDSEGKSDLPVQEISPTDDSGDKSIP